MDSSKRRLSAADFPISPATLQNIEAEIITEITSMYTTATEKQLVVVAGQPASGKTRTIQKLSFAFDSAPVVLDSDQLRLHHPRLDEIMAADPQRMDVLSNGPVGQWMKAALHFCRDNGYHTIVENTLTNPGVVAETAQDFAAAGFSVTVVALAVHEDISSLGIVTRYLDGLGTDDYPRWTATTSHDAAYESMVTGLPELTGVVDGFEIYNRQGHNLYAGSNGDRAAEIMAKYREAGLSAEEKRDWAADYGRALPKILAHNIISDYTVGLLEKIHDSAQRLIASADLPAEHFEFQNLLQNHHALTPTAEVSAATTEHS